MSKKTKLEETLAKLKNSLGKTTKDTPSSERVFLLRQHVAIATRLNKTRKDHLVEVHYTF